MRVTNRSHQVIIYTGRRKGTEVAKLEVATNEEQDVQCPTPDEYVITIMNDRERPDHSRRYVMPADNQTDDDVIYIVQDGDGNGNKASSEKAELQVERIKAGESGKIGSKKAKTQILIIPDYDNKKLGYVVITS